jgi:hypothetical protein
LRRRSDASEHVLGFSDLAILDFEPQRQLHDRRSRRRWRCWARSSASRRNRGQRCFQHDDEADLANHGVSDGNLERSRALGCQLPQLPFTDRHRLRLLGELRVRCDRRFRRIVRHERRQVRVGDSV